MIVSTVSPSYHNQALEQKPVRDSAYKLWREQVATSLLAAGMDKSHELWVNCSDPASFFVPDFSGALPAGVIGVNCCSHDPNHQSIAVCPTCQLRFCPDCCHRQTARLLARYMPYLRDLVADSDDVYRLRHIILTTPIDLRDSNCREQVEKLCRCVVEAFGELLGKNWREDCGLLFAYEFGEQGLKLHFHILAYCPYIAQSDLVDAWSRVTGGLCQVAYIRLVTNDPESGQSLEDAAAEVLKYATKLWKRDEGGQVKFLEPSLVPVLAEVLRGRRRIRSYGLFYKIEVEEQPHVCETCASPVIRLSPVEWDIWCQTGWMPNEFAEETSSSTLNSILGNNFSRGSPEETTSAPIEQVILPGFSSKMMGAYRNQFLKGK